LLHRPALDFTTCEALRKNALGQSVAHRTWRRRPGRVEGGYGVSDQELDHMACCRDSQKTDAGTANQTKRPWSK
jgi:hypothetical protein